MASRMPSVENWQNKALVSSHLALFKTRGAVDHSKTLTIPDENRIPVLVKSKEGRASVLIILSAAIGAALKNMNLQSNMNDDQVVELADAVIDSAHEDHLGIEDVMLFLRDMVMGKAGKIYNRMDIPTFFEMFETYRQDRYTTLRQVREEKNAQYKALGPTDRSHDDVLAERDTHRKAMSEHLRRMYKENTETPQAKKAS